MSQFIIHLHEIETTGGPVLIQLTAYAAPVMWGQPGPASVHPPSCFRPH